MTNSPDYYRFVACTSPDCRLRFPGVDGVACPLCQGPTQRVADRCNAPPRASTPPLQALSLLLDNVRSVFNVGSIFRTADGCGIGHIDLCGITPTPAHAAMKKTALGAEKTIAWRHHNNSLDHAQELLRTGKLLWALEYTDISIDLDEAQQERPTGDLVLVLGNEVTGIDPGLLDLCERTVHIPMRGQKASLNVATAAGIACYALT